MLDPESPQRKLWETIMLIWTIYAAVEAPLRIVFGYELVGPMVYIDYLLYAFFAIDILVRIRTGFFVDGTLVTNQWLILKRYASSWLIIDLLAAIPFDYFTHSWIAHATDMARVLRLLAVDSAKLFLLLQLIKFFKVHRLAQVLRGWGSSEVLNPGIMRLLFFGFWITIGSHWISCVWLLLGKANPDLDSLTNYIRALYFVTTTMTTIGYGDITPSTNVQTVFTMGVQIFGAGMYGYLIGNLASIIASIDIAKTHHLEKMEKISAFMRFRDIPLELQTRIRTYYNYLWEKRRGYDESEVLVELPSSLKMDVALHLNREIIAKVPLFKGASASMIRDLVQEMHPEIFMPGDMIFQTGDIGEEMYFISKGVVEVLSTEGNVVATLTDGQFFGEIALLLSMPRTASVQAREFCDLYKLEKEEFDSVLSRYPEFAAQVKEEAERRRGSPG